MTKKQANRQTKRERRSNSDLPYGPVVNYYLLFEMPNENGGEIKHFLNTLSYP